MPYANFTISASVLDRSRLGKQRVECLQILKALKAGPYKCKSCHIAVTHFNSYKTGYHCYNCESPLTKTPWYNHPAVQMWKKYETGLMLYLYEICSEWIRRGYKDTCWVKAIEVGFRPPNTDEIILLPDWLGNESFHLSHQSNLLRKNPEHYKQFFMGIPNDLPYVWPSKEKL